MRGRSNERTVEEKSVRIILIEIILAVVIGIAGINAQGKCTGKL